MFASPRVNSIALHLAMTFAKEKWILRASARRGCCTWSLYIVVKLLKGMGRKNADVLEDFVRDGLLHGDWILVIRSRQVRIQLRLVLGFGQKAA